jgi:hypothetical protein
MNTAVTRLFIVVTIGLLIGALVAGAVVTIQAGIDAANHHFETLDAIVDP